ncbi:MAG: phosphate acetyltransferase [Parasporobacterium sp.]|nr:phosphate acetyltransferase [Parasporobacterium sp.]
MAIIDRIEEKARKAFPKIIFPEAEEVRILEVAREAVKRGLCQPILMGEIERIEALAAQNNISLNDMMLMEPNEELKADYAARFAKETPGYTEKMALRKFREPLFVAACAVHFGEADSFIAGYRYTTGDVILAASTFIGMAEGNHTVSSFNLVTIPGFQGSEGEDVIFTDVAVCVNPSSEQLAQIAILAADAAAKLLDWTPRVAFLSYSTKGSGESDMVDKVVEGLSRMKKLRPEIEADGEFQLEVALSPSAAAKKLEEPGTVAGRANIIVFPDLNAGNTNIKAVKLFSHAGSIGPVLTGFRIPISDLSRTGSIDHLLGTVATVAALCGKE